MTTAETGETFVTTGDIAQALGRRVCQVRYAIESRDIRPAGRAGLVRLFRASAIEAVHAALEEIDARRKRTAGGGVPP